MEPLTSLAVTKIVSRYCRRRQYHEKGDQDQKGKRPEVAKEKGRARGRANGDGICKCCCARTAGNALTKSSYAMDCCNAAMATHTEARLSHRPVEHLDMMPEDR